MLAADRYWSKVDKKGPEDCWPWTASTDHKGYGQFKVNYILLKSHRVSYELANGSIPEGGIICHKCDNTLCCNPVHLYCGTQKDNMRDKENRNPTNPKVLGGGKAKLYKGEIWLIRKLWREGRDFITQAKIAKMFKVSPGAVSKIVNSVSWLCREGHYV